MTTVDTHPERAGWWPRGLRALRHRNYRLFFFGQLISLIGSWMQSLAQGWLVWRLSHSTFQLGLVSFCQMGPVLVLGLIGGLAADRFDRHRLILLTQSAALIQAVLLTALTLTGQATVLHIQVLAVMLGTINAFDMPGRQSFLVQMVGREDLPNAIALNSSIFNGARIVGPALAGWVVARWGEGICFLINTVSYLAVLVGLLSMQVVRADRPPAPQDSLAGLMEGFRYVRQTPHVRWLLGLLAVSGFFGMSYIALMPAMVNTVLGRGAEGLGTMMSAAGIGALSAALFIAHRRGIEGLGHLAPAMGVAGGLAVILFSLSRNFLLSCVGIGLVGFFLLAQMSCVNTLLQSHVPDSLRGRLMSIYVVTFIGMSPLGSVLLGRLAARYSVPPVLAAGGAVVALTGLLFWRPVAAAVDQAGGPPVPQKAPSPGEMGET